MNSESVDLIYADPPFNSKKNYAAPIGTRAAGAAFTDTWSLDDVKKEWVEDLQSDNTATWSAITAAGYIHGESSQAYLTYMAIRLLEMRRILRLTGSIYLHCDPTMSHYLKTLMDAIFGSRNFRNEITWCYKSGGVSKRWFARKHDVILFYCRDVKLSRFNVLKEKSYGQTGGGHGKVKHHRDKKGAYSVVSVRDWWTISMLATTHGERTGYPTQKPLKLLYRVIRASSNEQEMVFDPFCGCATTCVAAEALGRQWTGVDIEEKARDLVEERLRKEVYKQGFLEGTQRLDEMPPVYHFRRPPKRTDADAPRRSPNIKHVLYGQQAGRCNAPCGTDGKGREFPMDIFEIDHIRPRSKGGSDTDENLQLLCPTCNRRKGSKAMARFLELMEE